MKAGAGLTCSYADMKAMFYKIWKRLLVIDCQEEPLVNFLLPQ